MMAVASNRLAAVAGLQILKSGGSAADAAIAAQAVLGLVEPETTGIGGSGVLLYYDAKVRVITYDEGLAAAPAAASATMASAQGGRGVGVPGMVPLLDLLYRQHGHLPWASLFQPAIKLATDGFPVSGALARAIAANAQRLARMPGSKAYFLAHGVPHAGTILKNPDYADMLRHMAADGSAALMRGPVAADIASAVRADVTPGLMTADDLAAYHARQRDPLCAPYRQWSLCSAAPPAYGGLATLETLDLLSHFELPPQNPGTALLFLDAERLAAEDAGAIGGDPDFSHVEAHAMLTAPHLTARAGLIHAGRALPSTMQFAGAPDRADSAAVLADAKGNAVILIGSLGGVFGSRLLLHGFLLNDSVGDFSPSGPNRTEPGKRPATAMAPVIALDAANRLVLVIGTAGGSRAPGLTVQTLVALLDWQLDPVQALSLPHIVSTGAANEIESSRDAATLAAVLRARGEKVSVGRVDSASVLIRVGPKGLAGAADPRREGVALGD
jgi:gamma-glutamyltranspeptidase/glutathione hydrolase